MKIYNLVFIQFIKYIYLMKIECMSILTMMMKFISDMLVMKKLLKNTIDIFI